MDEKDYIKNRLDDQITWYSDKSVFNKRCYNWLQGLVVVLATLIPLLSGFKEMFGEQTNLIVGIIGVSISIMTGLLALFKFQKKWTNYRLTSEILIREKNYFETKTVPYNDSGTNFQLLVKKIENIIASENSDWYEYIRKKDKE